MCALLCWAGLWCLFAFISLWQSIKFNVVWGCRCCHKYQQMHKILYTFGFSSGHGIVKSAEWCGWQRQCAQCTESRPHTEAIFHGILFGCVHVHALPASSSSSSPSGHRSNNWLTSECVSLLPFGKLHFLGMNRMRNFNIIMYRLQYLESICGGYGRILKCLWRESASLSVVNIYNWWMIESRIRSNRIKWHGMTWPIAAFIFQNNLMCDDRRPWNDTNEQREEKICFDASQNWKFRCNIWLACGNWFIFHFLLLLFRKYAVHGPRAVCSRIRIQTVNKIFRIQNNLLRALMCRCNNLEIRNAPHRQVE